MVLWLILLCGFIRQCDGVTYQLSIVPETVAIGETLTITAKLIDPSKADTDLRIVLTQPAIQTVTIFQYRTATGCILLQEPYISTGTVATCDPSNSRYVIRFQSVTAVHAGKYALSAPLERPVYSERKAVVQLLVAPTGVTITPWRREVIEGQSTSLFCTVDDQATMPVTFVWKKFVDGNRSNPSAATTTRMLNYGRSNELSWNSVSRQHAGQYECTTVNEAGRPRSQFATLVAYYPATSVTLSTGAGTTTVSAGTTVMFTCTSNGGNPRPGLVVYDLKSGATLKESVQGDSTTLTSSRAMQASDNGGVYACRTKVNVGAGDMEDVVSNILKLNVQFPSIITSPDSVTVDEGQSESVRCETMFGSNPKMELSWTGPAVGRSAESTSPGSYVGVKTVQTITLTGDRTRNGDAYTCTGTHLGKQTFKKSTKLNVNFAPRAIDFYRYLDVPIPENQRRVIRCRAGTSNPVGTIAWRKILKGIQSAISFDPPTEVPGDFEGMVLETEITIQPSRGDNGAKYWCEVEYTYMNGSKITRRSLPKVIEVFYPFDVGIIVSSNADNIREGDPITLTCMTSGGNPQSIDQYTWMFNGNLIQEASTYTLDMNPIKYDQGGNYSCLVTNKGGTSTGWIIIDVKYKPKLDLAGAHLLERGAAVGENATFYLTILANPPPTEVAWTLAYGGNFDPKLVQQTVGKVVSLHIKDITAQDFTTYQCRVTNSVGVTRFLVTLRSEGPPEIPSRFRTSARSNSTITLHWTSEFSGAQNQTFLVELASKSNQEFVLVLEVADPGSGSVVAQIVNLQPDTEYSFRMRSKNNLGFFSPYTGTITEKTKPGMDMMKILISHVDETTVVVEWLATGKIFNAYSDADVYLEYTPVRESSSDAQLSKNESFTVAKFADRKTLISVSKGVIYAFDVIIKDRDNVVFVLEKFRIRSDSGEGKPSGMLALVVTSSVLAILVLTSTAIIIAVCCRNRKLKSQLKRDSSAPPVTSTATSSNSAMMFSTASDNAAFEEENPYMLPVDADPAYYHYSGNKYAVVGKPDVTNDEYDAIFGDIDEKVAIDD